VRVIFHGGEPLLLKKHRFEKICQVFLSSLVGVANVEFSIQTNAMLVDSEWIDIFERYKISVGVSMDGPAKYNDEYRLDHKGQGTHSRVVVGLRLLQQAALEKRINQPGILVVINPNHSARTIFNHVANELGARYVNFLLPMTSHDMPKAGSDEQMSTYLYEIAQSYLEHQEKIVVRIVSQFLAFIAGASPMPLQTQLDRKSVIQVSISTDGHIGPDDELKPLNIFREFETVFDTTLFNFLNSEFMTFIDSADNTIPTDCRDCCWQNYCRGGTGTGALISRYSQSKQFDNKSVHCNSLRPFYAKLANDAITNGLAESLISDCLLTQPSPYLSPFDATPKIIPKIIPILSVSARG
jgi:uncharacterized protein